MRSVQVAAVQMVSSPSVAENLAAAARLIERAAGAGAELIALPEYFCIMGLRPTDKVAAREQDGSGPIQDFLAGAAARHRVWLIGGSVPLRTGDEARVRSACLVFDDKGRRVARYDKIHLFNFEHGSERYRESDTIEPGRQLVAVDMPFGRVGLSICYDVRFPELYRSLGPCDLILVPSAFTAVTGAAHWELLLRARAVENQAFVAAPAQGGHHPSGRHTHGHTMIVDPWGNVLAEEATGEAVVSARLEPHVLNSVRSSLPALEHRVGSFNTGQ
jgi:predicted amidohydrolase